MWFMLCAVMTTSVMCTTRNARELKMVSKWMERADCPFDGAGQRQYIEIGNCATLTLTLAQKIGQTTPRGPLLWSFKLALTKVVRRGRAGHCCFSKNRPG